MLTILRKLKKLVVQLGRLVNYPPFIMENILRKQRPTDAPHGGLTPRSYRAMTFAYPPPQGGQDIAGLNRVGTLIALNTIKSCRCY